MKANIFGTRKPIIFISIAILFFLLTVVVTRRLQYKSNIAIIPRDQMAYMINSSQPNQNRAEFVSDRQYQTTKAFEEYKPQYFSSAINPSNYGDRYSTDIYGRTLNNQPLIVLHETVGSATSAINTFKNHHSNDLHQSSYHALITLDGTIIYLVPSNKRAFGAGNSVFKGARGVETVQTNPNLPPSVNNFAYHISLETPPDGRQKSGNSDHSGYTDNQYKSLAWLLALSDIPDERITTHEEVDLSGHRFDPRSFDFNKFFNVLHAYRQPTTGDISTQ